mgnify:CR=1 FL=1
MQYTNLYNGDLMPSIGLGTWKSSQQTVTDAVNHALQTGYQHIDCAPIYMNEKNVGHALEASLQKKVIRRDALWVTSKLWNSFHAPENVAKALKETLHYLRLDYLDAYLIHWPVATKFSCHYRHAQSSSDYIPLADLPLEDTWQAMIECQKAGLTRHIGVSNFSINKITQLINNTGISPSINQVECHPYLNQNPLRQFCQQQQIALTAYAPLGSADRPQIFKAADEPSLLEHPKILEIATQHQATAAQVLIQWSLAKGNVVIPKSTHPERIEQNLAAAAMTLSSDTILQIDQLNIDYRFIKGDFFTINGSPYTVESLWC